MHRILEAIDKRIAEHNEGANPVKLSNVMRSDTPVERYKRIEEYFGASGDNFSYEKFAKLFDVGFDTPFGVGLDNAKKINAFGEKSYTKSSKSEEREMYYDEYLETFFIYLYYQVFMNVLSTENIQEINADGIEEASKILSEQDDNTRENVVQGLKDVYSSCMRLFLVETRNLDVAASSKSRSEFIETFANKNIGLFTAYPISSAFRNEFGSENKSWSVGQVVESIYDCLQSAAANEQLTNPQALSIGFFSQFIKGDSFDFDVDNFAGDSGERFRISPKPNFSTSAKPVADSILEALSDGIGDDDLKKLGFTWILESKWKPFVKVVMGIKSLTGIDKTIAKVAKSTEIKTREYKRLLDADEKDGGLHFINNYAFYETVKNSKDPDLAKISTLIFDFNDMIERMSKKVNTIIGMNDSSFRAEALLTDPQSNLFADTYDELNNETDKKTIQDVLFLTNFPGRKANTALTVAELNEYFFDPNKKLADLSASGIDFSKAIKFAAETVASYDLKHTISSEDASILDKTENALSFGKSMFMDLPYNVVKSIWDGISNKNVSEILGNLKMSIWDNFEEKWFKNVDVDVQKELKGKKTKLTVGNNSVDLNSAKDWIDYTKSQSKSMISVLCHGKVIFAESGSDIHNDKATIEANFKKYDNQLSWLILRIANDPQMKESYKIINISTLVTPFVIEVLKFSFRAFINNIHNIVGDDNLAQRISEANDKEHLEEGEWKELLGELKEKLTDVLKDRLQGHVTVATKEKSSEPKTKETRKTKTVKATTKERKLPKFVPKASSQRSLAQPPPKGMSKDVLK